MLRFILKLCIFALIAAVASFYLSERPGSSFVHQFDATDVSIADLVRNPTKYDGSVVRIAGKPAPGARLSILGFGGYFVEDGAGNRIAVLVKKGIPPSDQAMGTVSLVGVVKNLVEIGSFSYPTIVLD